MVLYHLVYVTKVIEIIKLEHCYGVIDTGTNAIGLPEPIIFKIIKESNSIPDCNYHTNEDIKFILRPKKDFDIPS